MKLVIGVMFVREEEIGVVEDFVGISENALINYVSWLSDGIKIVFMMCLSGELGELE